MKALNVCPACSRLNPPDANQCVVCESALGSVADEPVPTSEVFVDLSAIELDTDTTPAVHVDAPELRRWFDSRTGGIESNTARADDTAAAPLDLTLRPLDDLPVLADAVEADVPTLPPGLIVSDPDVPVHYATDDRAPTASPPPTAKATPAAPPKPRTAPPPAGDAPSVTKATRRAAVRRKRLAGTATAADPNAPADVLVLEHDDGAREQLCGLLETFGFRAHPVQTAEEATRMLSAKPFVAAFLDLAFEGAAQAASAELCVRVKALEPHKGGRASALIIVSGSGRPVERVRAALAGSDAFVAKPLNRGNIAQALEACDVALPADSRRG